MLERSNSHDAPLARLADIAYRRRGRMVLAWIAARGRDHRPRLLTDGRVQRRLQHAGLGVQGGQRPHREALRRLLGPGDLRRLEGPGGSREPGGAGDGSTPSSPRRSRSTTSTGRRRFGSPRTARSPPTTLPLTVPGWEVTKEDGEQLIAAAEDNSGDGLEIKLGGDPIYAAQERSEPGGDRLPRRRDRAADRLRLAGRGRAAAGDRPGRPRHHLRRPDRSCSPTSSTSPTGPRRCRG